MSYSGVVKDVFKGEEYEIPESWYHPELYMRDSCDCESENDFVDLRDSGDLVFDLMRGSTGDNSDNRILGLPTPEEYFASIAAITETCSKSENEKVGEFVLECLSDDSHPNECNVSVRDHVKVMRANNFIAFSKDLKCKICSHLLKEIVEVDSMTCVQCFDIRQPVRVLFQSTYVIPARRNTLSDVIRNVKDEGLLKVVGDEKSVFVSSPVGTGVVLDRHLIDSEEVVDLAQYKMIAKEMGIPIGHRGFLGVRDENYVERGTIIGTGDPFMPYCTDDEMREINKRTSIEKYDDSIVKVGHVLKQVKGEDRKAKIDVVSPRTIFGFQHARSANATRINKNCILSILSYFRATDYGFARSFAYKNLGNTYFSVFSELLAVQCDGFVRIRHLDSESDRRDRYRTVALKVCCESLHVFLFSLSEFFLELPSVSIVSQMTLDYLEDEYDAIFLFEILHLSTLRKMLKMLRKHLSKDGYILVRICVLRNFSVFNSFNAISAQGLEEFLKFKFCSVKHYVKMFTDLDLYATEVDDDRKNGIVVFYLQN